MKHLLIIFSLLTLAACASAGPMVTNIAYDAGGNLVIEKCKVKTNFFLETMELEDCNTHNLQIHQTSAR